MPLHDFVQRNSITPAERMRRAQLAKMPMRSSFPEESPALEPRQPPTAPPRRRHEDMGMFDTDTGSIGDTTVLSQNPEQGMSVEPSGFQDSEINDPGESFAPTSRFAPSSSRLHPAVGLDKVLSPGELDDFKRFQQNIRGLNNRQLLEPSQPARSQSSTGDGMSLVSVDGSSPADGYNQRETKFSKNAGRGGRVADLERTRNRPQSVDVTELRGRSERRARRFENSPARSSTAEDADEEDVDESDVEGESDEQISHIDTNPPKHVPEKKKSEKKAGLLAGSSLSTTTPTTATSSSKVLSSNKRKSEPGEPELEPETEPEPQLDYSPATLAQMPYSALAEEPFDKNPNLPPPTLPRPPSARTSIPFPTTGDGAANLESKLTFLASQPDLNTEELASFFAALPIDEWEESGEIIMGKMMEAMNKMRQQRREKRTAMLEIEAKIGAREEVVRKRMETVEEEIERLKREGRGIIAGGGGGGGRVSPLKEKESAE